MAKGVRFAALQWARDIPTMLHRGRVDDLAHYLLVVMATYAKNDGSDMRASLETLARNVRKPVGDTLRALERLESAGLIRRATLARGVEGWVLELGVQPSEPDVLEARVERRRAATRDRVRRHRERQRETAGNAEVQRYGNAEVMRDSNAAVERYVTPECGVTEDPCNAPMKRCNAPGSVTTAGQRSTTPLNSLTFLTERANADASRPKAGAVEDPETSPQPPLLQVVPELPPAKPKPARAKRTKTTDPEAQRINQRANELARRYYDSKNSMVKFQAVRGVLARALKVYPDDVVTEAVEQMLTVDRNRPFTLDTLRAAIERVQATPATPTASADAAAQWLRGEWEAGRVRPIEQRTGLRYPEPDVPLSVSGREATEKWQINAARQWIHDNHKLIIQRLTARNAS